MSENHKIVQVFVASPSGLDDERRAVWEVIEEINRRNSMHWKLQFKAIGWEDTVGGNRRAQDIINRDLETCDYFFGILADHWGSPPHLTGDADNGYTSGFHEEYELAQKLFVHGKMRDIFLFFKSIPDERLRDIGPSLQKVLDFKKKVRDDRKPLYAEFEVLEEFKRKIGDALSKIGWESITPIPRRDIVAPSDPDVRESESPLDTDTSTERKKYYFSSETREFLRDINEKTGEPSAVTNIDVARLRMIASGMRRSGNDEVHVGVHDANLLFLRRSELELSEFEKGTLLTAGLRYMEHQNVPFWCWTDGDSNRAKRFIQYRMIIGDESVSGSALKIATVFGYNIPEFPEPGDRGYWIKKWFGENQAPYLQDAAQAYLRSWAEEEDVGALQEIRDTKSGMLAADLDCMIIGIKLRSSQDDGLMELKERNPEQISANFREMLRERVLGLSSQTLHELATLKSVSIRLESLTELVRRKALSQQLAEELSGDNSIDVRLEAIKALSDMSVPVSQERAKAALTITAPSRGLGGLLGSASPTSDSSRFDVYRRHLLQKKSLVELLQMAENDSPFVADALLTACQRFPRRTSDLLRNSLKDGFEGRFESQLKKVEEKLSSGSKEFGKSARDLKGFCCLRQTQAALEILAGQLKRRDLALVRETVDRWEIQTNEALLVYFSRFGSWEDVERILKLKDKIGDGYTVMGAGGSRHEDSVGRALLGVGSVRFVDLLGKIESDAIRAKVIEACTKKTILGLVDETVLQLLNDGDDRVRKTAALRCIESFPKSRLRRLLDVYIDQDKFRYYNVIHWLDLGVTMPRQFVKRIVTMELETA